MSSGSAWASAPITGSDVGIRRAEIRQGVREVVLCKDNDGKIGLRLKAIDNVRDCSRAPSNSDIFLSLCHADTLHTTHIGYSTKAPSKAHNANCNLNQLAYVSA